VARTNRSASAVLIDRDGVIIEDKDYVHRTEDLHFTPGAVKALQALTRSPHQVMIVTNQAGIARGYYSEADYAAFTEHLLAELARRSVRIDAVYYCPHHPTEGVGEYRVACDCRKPGTGMLRQASDEHDLDLGRCWLIGDKTSDIQAGADAGCRTILVRTGYGGRDEQCSCSPDYVARDLQEAVDLILAAPGPAAP